MNKYEASMMTNLTIMKAIFYVLLPLNMALPLLSPYKLGVWVIFQWIIVIAHFITLRGGLGYREGQGITMKTVGMTRMLEFMWYAFVSKYELNGTIFGILLLLDVLFIGFMLLFKGSYGIKTSRTDEDMESFEELHS